MTSKVTYKGELRTSSEHLASGSKIMTDAPIDNNGNGELFSPTDTVATALASCMITVMGIKAGQSKIDFNKVSADVKKVMSSAPRRISEIQINIIVGDNWDDGQRKLMEATGRTCPVAKSLHPDLLQSVTFTYK